MNAIRTMAATTALTAAGGLVLQYILFADKVGIGLATWRFVGFFTIVSNAAIMIIAAAIALGRASRLTGARARLMGLTAIVTVGFVYSLLLRAKWNPEGWDKVADAILHDVTPILFAVLWALMPHGGLDWRDLKWALSPPALYVAYAMARGAVDGWYPYYFLNPALQSPSELAIGIAGTLAMFTLIAASAIAIDTRLTRRAS